ncbi:isopenicillin N synthase family oxygenase [Marinomonas agarivorans]|nr:isopenicillin N synthase family oxygenase [Marinomonas agarivorans]
MQKPYSLNELNVESTIGGVGHENNNRDIPIIDFSHFTARREEIKEQLWRAATEVGFFQIANHAISLDDIQHAFHLTEQFFHLPQHIKQQFPLKKGLNAGWEFREQIRPSTKTADEKESYQITLPHMENLWPTQQLANFRTTMLDFEQKAWQLNMDILSCFAEKLGFAADFFTQAHDRTSAHYQSTLRLLHYLPVKDGSNSKTRWRAGAHTDFDCLTMVFQQDNQGGLQVCPGKDIVNDEKNHQQVGQKKAGSQNTTQQNMAQQKPPQQKTASWTDVKPVTGIITCNIGDMLMRWSDDQLRSTLHRVRMPTPEESQQSRYSMAFFAQANKDILIQGREKKYAPITADDYLQMRIAANFVSQSP